MESRVSQKDVINKIQNFIKALPKNDKKLVPYLSRLVSYLAINELTELCNTVESTAPIESYLKSYWDLVSHFDCDYFNNPELACNVLNTYAAVHIGNFHKKNPYDLLIPGVRGVDPNKHLFEYILREKTDPKGGQKVLLVKDGFLMLEKKYLKNEDCDLTTEEENLLATHSPEAERYYNAIMQNPKDVSNARNALTKALEGTEYKVKATYQKKSNPLIANLVKVRSNTQDFLKLFVKIPRENWAQFIEAIPEKDLFKHILDINNFDKIKQKIYANRVPTESNSALVNLYRTQIGTTLTHFEPDLWDEKYIAAWAFCMCWVYENKVKPLEPEFKTMTGEYVHQVKSWLTAVPFVGKKVQSAMPSSSAEKESAVKDLLAWLTDPKLMVRGFFKTPAYQNPAFRNGLLSEIALTIDRLCTDERKLFADGAKSQIKKMKHT